MVRMNERQQEMFMASILLNALPVIESKEQEDHVLVSFAPKELSILCSALMLADACPVLRSVSGDDVRRLMEKIMDCIDAQHPEIHDDPSGL